VCDGCQGHKANGYNHPKRRRLHNASPLAKSQQQGLRIASRHWRACARAPSAFDICEELLI
jgi:hypothetical protein